jgi:predicted O-methyltransferase YrrM
MVDKIEMAQDTPLPDLSDAIQLYTQKARFCQEDPANSHLSVIYRLRESYGERCDYLEIGCLFGFSMVNATRSKTPGKFVGIDLFESTGKITMNDYTSDVVDRDLSLAKTTKLVKQCNIHNHDISFIQGNSQWSSVQRKILSIAPTGFDMVFIDGDHSFEGTYGDFSLYGPSLRPGGYMLFDDQDYPEIARVIVKIKNEHSKHYEWVPWEGYAPKFRGFFKKC